MSEPVLATDGFTYERSAVERWFETHDTSPMTGARVVSKRCVPNLALRSAILDYKQKQRGKK